MIHGSRAEVASSSSSPTPAAQHRPSRRSRRVCAKEVNDKCFRVITSWPARPALAPLAFVQTAVAVIVTMVDTGAARSGGSSGGTCTTNKSRTLHHFFAKRDPPAAASSQPAQQQSKCARPNNALRVLVGPTTPPTPAPRNEQLQLLLQRGTPPTPPSRAMSPRTPPSSLRGGEVAAADDMDGTDEGADDQLPPTSRKSNSENGKSKNTNSSSGGSGTSGNSQQTAPTKGSGAANTDPDALQTQQKKSKNGGRKMAPIFVSPVPVAPATKKSSVEDTAASKNNTARTGGETLGPGGKSEVNDTEDEKDNATAHNSAHQLGRKRPPLAPLFASPRSGADGGLAMMKVTPSSSTAKAFNGTNSKKRPRTTESSSGSAMSSNNIVTALSRSGSTISSSSATTQLYLDLGQSNFAARSICAICGMMTVHGMAEDDAEHERICSEYRKGVAFVGWKNERVVATFGLNKSRNGLGIGMGLGMGIGMGLGMANQQSKAKTMDKGGASTSGRIVEVRPTDPVQHRKLVRRVKAIVDQELGFANSSTSTYRSSPTAIGDDFDFAQGVEDDDEEEEASLFGKTAYLYVSNKTVVGFCTVEVIQSAHRLLEASPAADGQSSGDSNSSANDMSNLHRSTKPTKAMMGVHQLWCHSSHRKGKVATRMVDTARSQLVYGMSVPHDMVAFSSPTVAGLTFAKRYVETDTPLVYDCR